MANVLNKTTKEYLLSVNTPDYSTEDWIINPDLSNVEDIPSKYWKIDGYDGYDGYNIIEMNQEEKDIVDFGIENNTLINELEGTQEQEINTSSTEPMTIISINPNSPFCSGNYRIDWTTNVKRKNKKGLISLRVNIDNEDLYVLESLDSESWITQCSFLNIEWESGYHCIKFQASTTKNGKEISIKDSKVSVRRI